MKCSIVLCLMILALASATSAQNDARALWLVRSQNLTSDILKDAADLPSMQRAVLWMKLAQRWWREDPKRARTWILNAIEVVEQVPNKEPPEERKKRLETAQILLAIVTPLDQKLSNRLLTVLSGDKSTQNDGAGTAFALVEAATRILEENPKRAAELAALALRTGEAHNIDQLLYRLRALDPKLADSLFIQALALAKQNPGSMFTNILTYVAFPADRGRDGNLPVPPDSLRIELLQILMPSNVENNGSNCGAVAWLAPLYGEYERLLPQQWPVLRQAINACQSVSPQIQQRINDHTINQKLDTVESILRVAADTKELETRTNYKYRAAYLAKDHKDYQLALKILNDLSTDERKLMGEAWDSCQWDWAAEGAIEHYQNSRFREMNLLLDSVPSDFQPLAKAAFIYRLPKQRAAETGPIIQILNDAINGLRRSNIPAADKYNWYFPLLQATVKYQFADANAVLKDAITSLNQVREVTELDSNDYLRYIGAALIEMDEFAVKDALASITAAPYRAKLRLALLDATLERLKTTSRN